MIRSDKIHELICECENSLFDVFKYVDEIEYANQARVLEAFREAGIESRHFAPTTGYGYGDIGRDALSAVFARSLECEDALVRPAIASGTHAIYIALSGLLAPGSTMLCVTGRPYDTLLEAIGISGNSPSSLKSLSIDYSQIELQNDRIDIDAVIKQLHSGIRVVYAQRSRGYEWRKSLMPEDIAALKEAVNAFDPEIPVVVDNCYGEFTCRHEPSSFGADVIIGSLIKNPGGGIAPTGGYIAGKKKYIEIIENRLTIPGLGREVGSYAASYQPYFQGLFLAPHVTAQSLKTAALFSAVFEKLGFSASPHSDEKRGCIVQALRLDSAKSIIAFCRGIQKASPIDSMAAPEPWDMPGYAHKIIMAAGTFVQGASIELSADAPIREPYTVYMQGGLTYAHGKLAISYVLNELAEQNEIDFAKILL